MQMAVLLKRVTNTLSFWRFIHNQAPLRLCIAVCVGGERTLKQEVVLNRYKTVYQSTTTQLRNAILDGDVELATSILIVNSDPNVRGHADDLGVLCTACMPGTGSRDAFPARRSKSICY